MSNRDEQIRNASNAMSKRLMESGLLIQAGAALYIAQNTDKDTPPAVVEMVQHAWMMSAQHLWASVMGSLDEGTEPTPADMHRMDLIHRELDAWAKIQFAKMKTPPGKH